MPLDKRLELNNDCLTLYWKINTYRPNKEGESLHDNWSAMDFTVKRGDNLVYHDYKNLEWLCCGEVEELRDKIKEVLSPNFKGKDRIGFLELDIDFEFEQSEEYKTLFADLNLGYWETDGRGCLTGNQLTYTMGRYELERLLCYLQYCTDDNYDKQEFEKYCQEGCII